MLYLGGNIQSVIQDDQTDVSHEWKRSCCLMSHAYVINHSAFDTILGLGTQLLRETKPNIIINIDEWYCREIHPKLRCYTTTPERVIQLDGYSDVKRRDVTYRQQLTGASDGDLIAPDFLPKPQYEQIEEDGKIYMRVKLPIAPVLDDDQLPLIVLITCVHNQADLFQMIQWSYYNIDYPRNKMTWIIVDDSAHEHKISPLIDGKDISIKYVNCSMGSSDSFLSIAKKINIAMSYVTPNTNIILNYSPDCYYGKENIRARVNLMMAYPEYKCFGSSRYGVHDVTYGKSWEQHTIDGRGNPTIPFPSSISFTRDFWLERPFDETQYTMETYYFVKGRWNQILDIPYGLILIALTCDGNLYNETSRYGIKGKASVSASTGTATRLPVSNADNKVLTDDSKMIKRFESNVNFQDEWDLESRNIIMMLGRILTSKDEY